MITARWSPLVGAVVSAGLLGLFARVDGLFVALGFVALVPWLLALDATRSLAAATGSAALAAAVFTAAAFSWFPAAIASYASSSSALAWAVTLVAAPVLFQPQFLAFALGRHLARRIGAGRAQVAAVGVLGWLAAEWALPRLFADTLGYGLYPWTGLRQAADVAGARGLTLLLLVTSECVAMAVAARRPRPVQVCALPLLGVALGYGLLRERQIEARAASAPSYVAAVVQANITNYDKLAAQQGTFSAVTAILDTHFALSRRVIEAGAPPDLLIWPETVYPTTFGAPRTEAAAALDRAIVDLVAATSVPLVFGAFERDGDEEFNAAFFLGTRGPDGAVTHASYRKSVLFPLTEQVPGWFDSAWLRDALPWTGRWAPGPGPRVVRFALGDGAPIVIAPLICYEVTEPGYVAAEAALGADLLLTLSNDSWFPDQAAPRLHLIVAAFRSIETRLPQVRATNSGISALVTPTGELRRATGFGERAAFRVDVPRMPPTWTPVVAWGDWLGPTSLALAAALLGWLAIRRRAARRR